MRSVNVTALGENRGHREALTALPISDVSRFIPASGADIIGKP